MKFFGIVLNPGIQEQGGLTGIPLKTLLGVMYPNPGMRVMSIRYQVASAADVSLCVYDAAGRLVRIVVKGKCEPGYYTQVWDSRDDLGRKVPAGVYFVRFQTDDYQRTEKAVLLR
jgi:5-hydroxyisourate hydrolase-like protein (transthyretin family)